MIIDQLPLLSTDVQGTDEIPIERGTSAYKTTQAALIKSVAEDVDRKGLPVGGSAGQILAKVDGTDYNTHWINPPDPSGYVSYAQAQSLTAAQQTQARDNIGADWTLLWQNASPSSDFAAQDITVSGLSDYKYVIMAFKTYKADPAVTINIVPYSAGGTRDYPIFVPYFDQRVVSWNGNVVTFGVNWRFNSYGSYTTTVDNGYLIPYEIYGAN